MALPGSQQVGLGKKFLEQFQWQNFSPHREWAEFVVKSALSFDGCKWIWFPEGSPASNAPAAQRFFRYTFVLPDKAIKSAQVRMSADDQFTAYLNEKVLGSAAIWKYGRQFNDLGSILQPGTNLLAVTAENKPTAKANPNPAGLLARLEIQFADGESLRLNTDETWRCATNNPKDWASLQFDDASWSNALVLGSAGDNPWGKFDPLNNDDVYAPQSAGIPDLVRITYVPEPDSIAVRDLAPYSTHSASIFDPVTGKTSPSASFTTDAEGRWTCPPPSGCDHDWVMVISTPPVRPAVKSKSPNGKSVVSKRD
jgi:hypothetical protein